MRDSRLDPLNIRLQRTMAIAGVAALVVAQQLATVGGTDLLGETLTNAAHIPMFAALTLLLLWMLRFPSWIVLLTAAVAMAAVTEALQGLTGRNASFYDLGLDLLGIVPVVGAVEAGRRLRQRGRGRWTVFAVWLGAAVVVAVMAVAAPLRVLVAYAERDAQFPALLVPGAPALELLMSSNSRLEVVPAPAQWPDYAGQPVFEVTWGKKRYPGITLEEVVPSWQAFDALVVDVYLPEGPPMPLTAAVGHQRGQGTAAHLEHRVQPGPQRLRYDLGPLLDAPGEAPVRISKLILHANQDQAGRRLLIGSARLVSGTERPAAFAGNLAPSD